MAINNMNNGLLSNYILSHGMDGYDEDEALKEALEQY